MSVQKTWTDLLGKPRGNECVDGRYISREIACGRFKVLWSFPSGIAAQRCFHEWLRESGTTG